MKINNTQRLPGVITTSSNSVTDTARKADSRRTDRVEISGSKDEISKLKTLISQVPDPSIEKIPQIRQQLDKGIYHVEARLVAEKMLDRWKDFGA